MKTHLTLVLILITLSAAVAQPKKGGGPNRGRDPFQLLPPPDLIMQNEEALGLTQEQKQKMHAIMERQGPEFQRLQESLQSQTRELSDLIQKIPLNESVVREKFEKMLGAEQEIKKVQFTTLLQIRQILTADQQAKIQKIQVERRPTPPETQARMQKLNEAMQERGRSGEPMPEEIPELTRKIHSLLGQNKFKEADPLLDRAIELLE